MHLLTKLTFLLFIIANLWMLSSCNENTSCKLGKPTAIFPEQVPSVTNRVFEVNNNTSTENIIFDNGLQLEIFQDGCDFVRQEFRFTLNEAPDSTSSSFWTTKAANLFHYMADQSEHLVDFHLWGGAIEAVAPKIRLGERTPLDGPFTIKVDKINLGEKQTMLMVILSNEPL